MMRLLVEKGYTLVETMIVLAITGLLAAIGLVNFAAQISHYNLNDAGRQIIADLRLVRQKAVAEGKPNTIQFDIGSQKYLLPDLGERRLPFQVQFGAAENVNKTVDGAVSRSIDLGIKFTNKKATFQPNGTIAPSGTIYLTNQNESLAVTVNFTGRVKLYRWSGDDWK